MSGAGRSLIVLSGGQSSRFGSEKGLYMLNGKPMVRHVIDSLSPLSDKVILQVAPGCSRLYAAIASEKVIVAEDRAEHSGPLHGLMDAARRDVSEIVMVAPCDKPGLTVELYSILIKRLDRKDAAMPFVRGYHEPITAVYRREPLIKALDSEIKSGGRKMSGILRHLDVIAVLESELERHGVQPGNFTDINSPP